MKINGRSLAQQLHSLITSSAYKALTDDDPTGDGSPKVSAIRRVLRQYKAKAFDAMLDEFPLLRAEINQKTINKAKSGARNFDFGLGQ